jgi:hypothetical protein
MLCIRRAAWTRLDVGELSFRDLGLASPTRMTLRETGRCRFPNMRRTLPTAGRGASLLASIECCLRAVCQVVFLDRQPFIAHGCLEGLSEPPMRSLSGTRAASNPRLILDYKSRQISATPDERWERR